MGASGRPAELVDRERRPPAPRGAASGHGGDRGEDRGRCLRDLRGAAMRLREHARTVLVALLLVAVTGCAPKTSPALGPAQPMLANGVEPIRTIAVVVETDASEPEFSGASLAKDAAREGGMAGARGTFFGFLELCRGMGLRGLVGGPFIAALGAVAAPIGALVGATTGALRADPSEVIDAVLPVLRRVVADAAPLTAIRDRLVTTYSGRFVTLDGATLTRREGHETDARLELSLRRVGLVGADSGVNPPLVVVLTVQAK